MSEPKLIIYIKFYRLLLARSDGCFDLSGPRSRRNGQHFPDDFTLFRPKCAYFWHIFGVFMTKCVYLRPNEYIDVQCGGFLEVIRVLQTVAAQIRPVGARTWSGWSTLSIISLI